MEAKQSAIEPLDIFFDVEEIGKSIRPIVVRCDFFGETNQISLRHRQQDERDPVLLAQDGIGTLYDFENRQWLKQEAEFKQNHPWILGTYLEEIPKRIEAEFKCKIGRYRLMRLGPRKCYSWHQDPDPFRFHIPLRTNPSCFYVTELAGPETMPTVGQLYRVNTAVHHTAMNCSQVDRYHLVLSTY